MKIIAGKFVNNDYRIGIVVGRFNHFITDQLLQGAVDCLVGHGVDSSTLTVVKVPGAFEIPLAAKRLAASKKLDGIIALGTIIRGATPHFDYVAGECCKGLGQLGLQYDIPVGFGVLTVDTIEQAIERAGSKAGNKGADAALAVLEMMNVLEQLAN